MPDIHTIRFWNSWPKAYRYVGLIIAMVFIFSLGFFWYSYWHYPPLSWEHIQELDTEDISIHTFERGLLELNVYGNNCIIFERLLGKPIPLNSIATYVLIGVLFFCVSVWLSIITLLKRLWYYVGMGLFIFFTASLHLELIGIFGIDTKLFVAFVLLIYAFIGFYFQFFGAKISFVIRWLTFLFVTIVLAGAVLQFANVDKPILHMAANGLLAASVISIIFICMVAHEIIVSFIYVVNQSVRQHKSINHFIIISIIYMANLALTYAHRIGMIEWNFTYINLFLLLTVSGILGIWGFRNRKAQYKDILPADPFGVYFILCMAIVCFATIGYFLATSNDAPLVAISDIILYTHIGYGLIFLLYVFSNFVGMMAGNIPVYNVLYRPNRMPYFTFRFAGLIATLAFVFYNTWQTPVNNLLSAIYQAEGDAYQSVGDIGTAEAFYRQAGVYGFLNHRSNYSLAQLKHRQRHFLEERNFYNRASRRRPTVFSYLNLSQTFQREQDWLGAMLELGRAKDQFPSNGPIANTIGIIYSKLHAMDSALYFFNRAAEDGLTTDMATANFVGAMVQNSVLDSFDSLLRQIGSDNMAIQGNVLALANIQDIVLNMQVDAEKGSPLHVFDAVLINNYLINRILSYRDRRISGIDTAFVSSVVKLSSKPANSSFRELLSFTCALAYYASGRVWDAISLLEETTPISVEQGRYNNVLALWAIEQRDPQGALEFLDYANNQKYEEANVSLAVALAESGRIDASLTRWIDLRDTDSTYRSLATKMIRVLTIDSHRLASLTDEEKYMYGYYRISLFDNASFDRVLQTIDNADLVAKAIFERSQKLFERDQIDAAARMLGRVDNMHMRDRVLYNHIIALEMAIMARQNKLPMLAKRIKEQKAQIDSVVLPASEQLHYDALLNAWAGDTAKADVQYRLLARYNPYDEESIIASARHLRVYNEDRFVPYGVLTDALYYNPNSVKLLKAYIVEASRIGFSEYADSALQRLQKILTQNEMNSFLRDNRNLLSSVRQ